MDSPFTDKEEQLLSDFCSGLYDVLIYRTLGEMGGNTMPENVIFPDIAEEYAQSRLSSVECIYLAGKRILEDGR